MYRMCPKNLPPVNRMWTAWPEIWIRKRQLHPKGAVVVSPGRGRRLRPSTIGGRCQPSPDAPRAPVSHRMSGAIVWQTIRRSLRPSVWRTARVSLTDIWRIHSVSGQDTTRTDPDGLRLILSAVNCTQRVRWRGLAGSAGGGCVHQPSEAGANRLPDAPRAPVSHRMSGAIVWQTIRAVCGRPFGGQARNVSLTDISRIHSVSGHRTPRVPDPDGLRLILSAVSGWSVRPRDPSGPRIAETGASLRYA